MARRFGLSDLNEKTYYCVEIDPPSEEFQERYKNSRVFEAQALRAGAPGCWVKWESTGSIGYLPVSMQYEEK